MKCFLVLALVFSATVALENRQQANRLRRDHNLAGASHESQEALSSYGASVEGGASNRGASGELDAQASERDEAIAGDSLDALSKNIPGVPGEDYPIFAEPPETSFTCEGKVNGGYYADSEAKCQVFHICSSSPVADTVKYSFLCPNGTIFNQAYFICDWWFNVDCSAADGLAASRNAELETARIEAESRLASEANLLASASANAPISTYNARGLDDSSLAASSDILDTVAPATSYGAAAIKAQESNLVEEALPAASAYGSPLDADEAASAPVGNYGAPVPEEAGASARVFEDDLPSYGRRR